MVDGVNSNVNNADAKVRVLVAEDDTVSALTFRRSLERAGYEVSVAADGEEAWELLKEQKFEALLTDWMMPRTDGIELIKRVRASGEMAPFIAMITAVASPEAKRWALDAGADYYVPKPVSLRDLVTIVEDGLARRRQPEPDLSQAPILPHVGRPGWALPPSVGVVIAASTGGPQSLGPALGSIAPTSDAAYFLVQHAPPWMLDTFAGRLGAELRLPVHLAEEGMEPQVGNLYLGAGDQHLVMARKPFAMHVVDGPKDNFIRPSADWLFRSAATVFGAYCVAVVMTGLGHDGTVGAAHIAATGGVVIAQDPSTTVMPYMPASVIKAGLASSVVELEGIGREIEGHVSRLSARLNEARAA